MASKVMLLLCACGALAAVAGEYTITVSQRTLGPDDGSILSFENGTSSFRFTFAPAYFPAPPDGSGPDGLLLRVQNVGLPGAHSGIAVVRRLSGPNASKFEKPDDSSLIIRCPGINGSKTVLPTAAEPCADDPRIVYNHADARYYMTYDNNSNLELSPRVTWVASSPTPWVVDSWIFHGPVWRRHTAGVSLLLRDQGPHYAIIGTADDAGSLYTATSSDLIHWDINTTVWQRGRPYDVFDWRGLAAGPSPVRLSDGNYLYFYSIDNMWNCQSASCNRCGLNCSDPSILKGCPNCLDGRCALGWMILDGSNPLRVLQRASVPVRGQDSNARMPCHDHLAFERSTS